MKRISPLFLVVALGVTIPLLGDVAKKADPLPERRADANDVTEQAYVLYERRADVLALLLRLYPTTRTEARTEPKDNRLTLVVKGPEHVHEAVGKFVKFLNDDYDAQQEAWKRKVIDDARKPRIIKPAKP